MNICLMITQKVQIDPILAAKSGPFIFCIRNEKNAPKGDISKDYINSGLTTLPDLKQRVQA